MTTLQEQRQRHIGNDLPTFRERDGAAFLNKNSALETGFGSLTSKHFNKPINSSEVWVLAFDEEAVAAT